MKRLRHSNVNNMTPVENWSRKVNRLNAWINANYEKALSKGIPGEIINTVYIQLHNRLKYTEWHIIDGSYDKLIFSACYMQLRRYNYQEGKYVPLKYDIPVNDEPQVQIIRINASKMKRCVKQLSNLQRSVFTETFKRRRTINDAAAKLNLDTKCVSNAYYNSIRRVAQLYNQ